MEEDEDDKNERLQQRITYLLQEIDNNFCKAHDIVVEIIRKVKDNNHHLKNIHSNIQIWKSFFDLFTEKEKQKQNEKQKEIEKINIQENKYISQINNESIINNELNKTNDKIDKSNNQQSNDIYNNRNNYYNNDQDIDENKSFDSIHLSPMRSKTPYLKASTRKRKISYHSNEKKENYEKQIIEYIVNDEENDEMTDADAIIKKWKEKNSPTIRTRIFQPKTNKKDIKFSSQKTRDTIISSCSKIKDDFNNMNMTKDLSISEIENHKSPNSTVNNDSKVKTPEICEKSISKKSKKKFSTPETPKLSSTLTKLLEKQIKKESNTDEEKNDKDILNNIPVPDISKNELLQTYEIKEENITNKNDTSLDIMNTWSMKFSPTTSTKLLHFSQNNDKV